MVDVLKKSLVYEHFFDLTVRYQEFPRGGGEGEQITLHGVLSVVVSVLKFYIQVIS